jgi:hypothetical protein
MRSDKPPPAQCCAAKPGRAQSQGKLDDEHAAMLFVKTDVAEQINSAGNGQDQRYEQRQQPFVAGCDDRARYGNVPA